MTKMETNHVVPTIIHSATRGFHTVGWKITIGSSRIVKTWEVASVALSSMEPP